MLVREIMSPNVETVTPELTLQQAAKKMRDLNIGCLLVQESKGKGDKLIGIITDRDITCRAVAEGANPETTYISDIMSMGAAFCFDDQKLEDCAQIMEAKKVHRLPVKDHSKTVIGLVSLTDLALKGSKELSAEILGEVSKYAH